MINATYHKKYYLFFCLACLQLFAIKPLLACTCGWTANTFCESIGEDDLLVLATFVAPGQGHHVYYKVVDGINNDLAGDTILIAGADGINCLANFGFAQDTVLMAFQESDSIYPLRGCGVFFSFYINDTLYSKIYPDQGLIAYADFRQNAQACLEMPPSFPGTGKLVQWRDTTKPFSNFPFTIDQFELKTDGQGNYAFRNIPLYRGSFGAPDDFLLQPRSNFSQLGGVSTADLVAMQKHILGLVRFTYPEQYIAADINSSKSISVLDVLLLRRLLLNFDSSFPNQQSWRFIPLDYRFPIPDQPLQEEFPEAIPIVFVLVNFEEYLYQKEQLDFRVIKMGDVI